MIHTITSTQNPRIRALRALHQAKARAEAGCFLVEGAKLCGEALRDASVQTLLVDVEKQDQFVALMARAGEVLLAPAHVVAAVCEAKTPQGIAASVRFPRPLDLDEARGYLLVLDGVQDPGNVGTMARTAEAAGFDGALLSPQCADAFSPKAVRASMGAMLRLPLWRGVLPEALDILRRKGFHCVGTSADGTPLAKARGSLEAPLALVIGSEGSGIGEAVSTRLDVTVALPMRGRAESLNAAVAAGILMYGLASFEA